MTTPQHQTIHEQVSLPVSVALEVVLQGIRIRLGRSIVTILGVALGIAFLMSILTTQLVTQGVSDEEKTRTELVRMLSFLTADTGPLHERTLGVIQAGPLNPLETRFLQTIREQGLTRLQWTLLNKSLPAPKDADVVDLPAVAKDASAVIVVGDGDSSAVDWSAVLAPARQKVIAITRPNTSATQTFAGGTLVTLSRELRADETVSLAAAEKRERARSIWIIVVSLLVTVIGISNSMLMSVTERFREIGTMKCLGALSSFIRRLFLIESTLIGTMGALLGVAFGILFPVLLYSSSYGFGMVFSSLSWGTLGIYGLFSLVVGVLLSMVAAVYPARFASRMVPAAALRSNI